MRDYETLRKALDRFLNSGPMGGPPCVVCFGDANCCGRPELRQALENTAETSEIERLIPWLEEQRIMWANEAEGHDWNANEEERMYDAGQVDMAKRALDHIRAEFGHGGEDADGS